MAAKRNKAAVDYGPGYPEGERCGICAHIERHEDEQPTCEVVVGHVRSQDWCKLFKAKGRR